MSVPARALTARRAYRTLAVLFAACVAAQVLLAGLSVFHDAGWWGPHRGVGTAIALLPVALVALTFAGRMPGRPRRLAATAFALCMLQGVTAVVGGVVGAVHPVGALLVFWNALAMTRPLASSAERSAEGTTWLPSVAGR